MRYVDEREAKRQRGLDVPRHRAFDGQAGQYVFAGRRNVGDCALALLRREDEVVVVAVDAHAPRWRALQLGDLVQLTAKGLLASRRRR